MPFIPGRAPNPSYYRGIAGSKDSGGPVARPAQPPTPSPRAEPGKPWGPNSAPRPQISAELAKRRAEGEPDPSSKAGLRSFTRAQLANAWPTSPQEANNLLEVFAEKGKSGPLSAAELKTITECVTAVKEVNADTRPARTALEQLIRTQDVASLAVQSLWQLVGSL